MFTTNPRQIRHMLTMIDSTYQITHNRWNTLTINQLAVLHSGHIKQSCCSEELPQVLATYNSSGHLHKHVCPRQGLNYTKEVILRAFYNQNKCPPCCFSTPLTHFFPFLAGLFLVLVASCFFLGVNFLGGGSTVTTAVHLAQSQLRVHGIGSYL